MLLVISKVLIRVAVIFTALLEALGAVECVEYFACFKLVIDCTLYHNGEVQGIVPTGEHEGQ